MITIKIEKKGKSDIEELMDRLKVTRDKIGAAEEVPDKSMGYVFYGIMIDEIYEVLDEMACIRLLAKWERRKHFPHNFMTWIRIHIKKTSRVWQKASR